MGNPGLVAQAARVRIVLTDCDGVLTDGGVYYSAHGEELKRFSMRDGMGVERLRTAGIHVGILTKERSPVVAARAAKLGLSDCLFAGITAKLTAAEEIVRTFSLTLTDLAYIGDDVNDLDLLRAAGFSAAPADAEPMLRTVVDVTCSRGGGHGAFRELAEMILHARCALRTRPTTLVTNPRTVFTAFTEER
jgi:3-deoxy-D-manno-octulosonate 8-phosphate phosphatase (KDO 8-P phosphatase)